MNHQGTKRLETERLILRRFVIGDADEMYRSWASDDEVTRYLTWQTHPNADVTRALLESWTARYEEADYYNWGIVQKEDGKLIGNISVTAQDEEKQSAELGWCMGKAWWGQGIMPEAAGAVVEYLFTEAGFQRITARHDQNNPKSGRVMQKLGMQYEETRKAGGKNNQGIADMVCYSKMRSMP